MIRATPNNGNPSVIVDSDVQSDIEDVMTALEYGCTDYTLEMAESAEDGDLDEVIGNLVTGAGTQGSVSPPCQSAMYQVHIQGRLHPDIGLDGITSMVSRKLFTTRAAAEAHAPEFIALCTGEGRTRHELRSGQFHLIGGGVGSARGMMTLFGFRAALK